MTSPTARPRAIAVRLEPWGAEDFDLLVALNAPEMTRYVGGPETQKELLDRQAGYAAADSRQYRVVVDGFDGPVGWVGYWELTWRDDPIWEIGWAVVPAAQGKGVAGLATSELLLKARREGKDRFVHAFPMVENAASNAICRKLGFELLGEVELEGRRGGVVLCHDWRLDIVTTDVASAARPG